MAKAKRPLTTEEALEALLGRKAARRIRKIAERLAKEDGKKGKTAKKKR